MGTRLNNPLDLTGIVGLTNPLVADLDANSFSILHLQKITFPSNTDGIDTSGAANPSAYISFDDALGKIFLYNGDLLINQMVIDNLTGASTIDSNNRQLLDIAGLNCVDWRYRYLIDTTGAAQALNWENRNLLDTNEILRCDWSGDSIIFPTDTLALTTNSYVEIKTTNDGTNECPTVHFNNDSLPANPDANISYITGGMINFDKPIKLPDISTIASPLEGMIAFNYTTHSLKYYNGAAWV